MNAIELHEYVSQWPEEARPKNLRLHTAGWFVEDRETGRMAEGETRRVDFQFCNPTTAIALHVASGLEAIGNCEINKLNDGAWWLWIDGVKYEGPSLFHAIHTAIVKGE